MNIDTGQIHLLTEAELQARQAAGERLVPIDELDATAKQLQSLQVSPHDTRSKLGRLRHSERSKYTPHLGLKEQMKAEIRASHEMNQHPSKQ